MTCDTIITGGTVVSDGKQQVADVAIRGEKIARVGKGLARGAGKDCEIVDARGRYVIPGVLDVHVHLALPFMGSVSSDDFDTGTRAAARGGVTTLIDFAIPFGKDSLLQAYRNWRKKSDGIACVDYAYHMAITNWDRHGPQMAKMVEMGCPTFKQFMIYESEGWQSDDRAIYSALEQCKELGAMLLIHAESSRVLDELIARHHTKPQMKKLGAQLHAITRPNFIESEAIQRAVTWSEVTGGRLYIVHMSTGEGADIIRAAQARGVNVFAETCSQYLVLDDSKFAGRDGHLYACCPQIKKKKDQKRLWEGIRHGEVSVVSTDTCSFTRKQKATWRSDWTKIPMGLPGLETLLPIVFTHGFKKKRMTMKQVVAQLCTNPAKLMGLFPRKGTLRKGADADVVVIDPKQVTRVDHRKMDTNTDWNPYQGWKLSGFAETTFSRGRKIVDQYKFVGQNGWGQWLPRHKLSRV